MDHRTKPFTQNRVFAVTSQQTFYSHILFCIAPASKIAEGLGDRIRLEPTCKTCGIHCKAVETPAKFSGPPSPSGKPYILSTPMKCKKIPRNPILKYVICPKVYTKLQVQIVST